MDHRAGRPPRCFPQHCLAVVAQVLGLAVGVAAASTGCGSRPSNEHTPSQVDQKDTSMTDPQTDADAMRKIVAAGPGVHAINKDAQGQVISFVVCGQARIWRDAFDSPAQAEAAAEEAALWQALAQAAKWMKSDVSATKPTDGSGGSYAENAEATLANFRTLHVEVAPSVGTITALVGFRPTIEDVSAVRIKVRAEDEYEKTGPSEVTRSKIFINGVCVMEDQTHVDFATGHDPERAHTYYRQWRASGIPCLEIECQGNESQGIQIPKARGFRESGLEAKRASVGGPRPPTQN